MAQTQPTTSESISEGLFTGAAGVTASYFGEAFIASLQAAISNIDLMTLEIQTQQDAATAGAEQTKEAGRKARLGYFIQGIGDALAGGIGIATSIALQSKQTEINGQLENSRRKNTNLTKLEQTARTTPPADAAGMNADRFNLLKEGNTEITPDDINEFSRNATIEQRQELLNNLTQVKNEISFGETTLRDFDTNYQMRSRAAESAVRAGANTGQGITTYEKAEADAAKQLYDAIEQAAQGSYRVAQQDVDTLISLLQTLVQAQQETARATSR